MSSSSFSGKVVDRIVDRSNEYGGIDIVFTDGSVLRVEGNGYEDSTVTMSSVSLEDLACEAKEREERAERDRENRLLLEARMAEEEQVKASLSTREYEAWMDEHRPGWRYRMMVTEEILGAYDDLVRSMNRQFITNRTFYEGGHVVPVFRDLADE